MDYLPLFVELKNRRVLVVGGGLVASHKIQTLLAAGATVRVVADELHPRLRQWQQEDRIEWLAQRFEAAQLDGAFLAIAATDDPDLNRQVSEHAEQCRLWVNVVDSPALCSFIFPSIIDRSPVQIALSSGGKAPVLIRQLREKLEALLPQNLGQMACIAGRWRDRVKKILPTLGERRRFWENLFTGPFASLVESRHPAAAEDFLQQNLIRRSAPAGDVTLVGAGPGDAGLMTLKGLQALQRADVILHDNLVSASVLGLARADAEKIPVAKQAGHHHVTQERINALLVELARQGKRVVRLKGGDPFVFGRGGEEAEVLAQHDIPYRIVPGVTAGLGTTAYAGIPLTHRKYAKGISMVTGHTHDQEKGDYWKTLATLEHTLVIYMGSLQAAHIQEKLIQAGKTATTPVAVISRGTLPDQKVVTGTLDDLGRLAANAPSPTLLVIGEVVTLRPSLSWWMEPQAKTWPEPASFPPATAQHVPRPWAVHSGSIPLPALPY
ncbi:MAG: siroheme synthase CysG [Xanthomonadaceae bacterium]|jgi:uroporphyrin-III C-methyltransferase/precorrin-2 dehydrogenase/sirohydrochlorin ferrochelatase|nr:siroheme synthase CysG [Xanthomonadaceae bacterium]